MSAYTISISGNSNDSDLVLASSGASITENGSSNLVPLTGRVNTLESSMNSVETRVSTLENFNLKGVFTIDSEFTSYQADYKIQSKCDIINLPLNGVSGNIKLIPGTVGPTNDYFEYITYLTPSGLLETGGGKEINLPTVNLPLFEVTPEIRTQLNGKTLDHFTDNGILGQWMETNGYSTTLTSEESYKLQYDFTNMPLWNNQDAFYNLQFTNPSLPTYLSPKMSLDRTKVVMLLDVSKNDLILYTGFFQRHTDFSGTPNANGSAQNYYEPHNTWVFYERNIKNQDYSTLFNSISQVKNRTTALETSMNSVESKTTTLETFVGDTRNVHLDKNLNGGLPMVNSILLRTDPSLILLDLKFTPDPSNIPVGGRIISGDLNNGLNANTQRQYESKPTFNITKNGETLASSYVNKFFIDDLFTDKTFGFGDSFERMQSNWSGGIFRNHIAKDNSDNFIFIIGGGGVPSMATGSLDASYVYQYDRYFLNSSSLLYNDLLGSQYTAMTPFADPNYIYNVDNNKKLLINYSRNFYFDLNENMSLFEPNPTLLKASNYPIYGSMDFDVSINKNVLIDDVSGFAFALNNLELFDSMGNLQAHSDVSFNNDLNVMCFGSSLNGSDFNFTGSVYLVGYVNDLSSTPHQFNFAALGAINGNYDFSNQELSGKQNLYLNIMANESSKTSFFNYRTVLVSWDTTKPNVPKYVSLLPQLVGNKISVYNKEIVMQI